jgi:hypothetical protein
MLVPEGEKRKRSAPNLLQGKLLISLNTYSAKLLARRTHLNKERRAAGKARKR